ncbi:hypothetical protein TrRE_jg9309 [Triparma retinervis]|uniref:Uncharacterized protein n=1 Tax=Triparma retinervis TaxID=2557542 RepID=A0A9W7DLI9_9STRA|nr:hypothetical protein TrRE_jg9309 [Triparma retinervis]
MSYFDHFCDRQEFKYDVLKWGEDEDQSEATKRWAEFKRTKIVDHLLGEEEKERNFLAYMYNQIYLFPQGGDAYVFFEGMKAGGDIEGALKTKGKEGGGGGDKETTTKGGAATPSGA